MTTNVKPPDRTSPALEPTAAFLDGAVKLGLGLEPRHLQSLQDYLRLLLETNQHMNLTAVTDPQQAWTRHLLDSLTLVPHLKAAHRVADLGSGGGLPGIPLAILLPDMAFTLIEATRKKARFLNDVKTALALANVQVQSERAETLGQAPVYRGQYDVVVGRAVGPLRTFLELAVPLLRVDGHVLAMKGRAAETELREAENAFEQLGAEMVRAHTDPLDEHGDAVVLEIRKTRETPAKYPRAPGMPKKRPL